MSRFFFNVRDGSDYPDPDGTDLPSIEAARRHAARYAGELLQSNPGTFWSGSEWKMEIADEEGEVLFFLVFAGFDAVPSSGTVNDENA